MFDDKFMQLLQAGGPEVQAEFFLRFLEDLRATRHGIVTAASNSDWQGINHNSHILLSLAGTIGATTVYDMAKHLNTQSTLQIGTKNATLPYPLELVRETDALIQKIVTYSESHFAKRAHK